MKPLQDSTGQLSKPNKLPPNPFKVPSDGAIFHVREKEKEARKAYAQEMRMKPVAEKSTFASRMAATVQPDAETRRKVVPRSHGASSTTAAVTSIPADAERTLAEAASPDARRNRPPRERVADFIAKKREIFLVQMSLDVKRAEIRKLEERILQREDALKRSEEMLESDAIKFDQFLRDNEAQVNSAIRDADMEAKKRQDRQMEIKRLNGRIAAARSELNKAEEHLADCERYKQFLDAITPAAHFEAERAGREQARAAAEATWLAECAAVEASKVDAANAKQQAEHDYAHARTQQEADRATMEIKQATANLAEARLRQAPPKPAAACEDAAAAAAAQSAAAMFFQHPEQLMDILADLEEQNLFLIQNTQEAEEGLDAVEATYKRTQETMNSEVEQLQSAQEDLEGAIRNEEETVELLRARAGSAGGGQLIFEHSVSLDDLTGKVEAVYRRCGFDVDPSASTLQMLTNIEMRLEDYLRHVAALPEEFWETHEKAREKERRHQARDAKVQATKEEQERRLRKALERAAAPVFRKVGRPVMFRSRPARKAKRVLVERRDDDAVELETFLAREML